MYPNFLLMIFDCNLKSAYGRLLPDTVFVFYSMQLQQQKVTM